MAGSHQLVHRRPADPEHLRCFLNTECYPVRCGRIGRERRSIEDGSLGRCRSECLGGPFKRIDKDVTEVSSGQGGHRQSLHPPSPSSRHPRPERMVALTPWPSERTEIVSVNGKRPTLQHIQRWREQSYVINDGGVPTP